MTHINLLPWRDNLREAVKKECLILLAIVVGLAIGLLGVGFSRVNAKLRRQQEINLNIQKDTVVLESSIAEIQRIKAQENQLTAKRDAVEQLQLERVTVVRLLEQMAYQMPKGVYLTQFDKKGAQLTLIGYAKSNALVSELMQKIEQSHWMGVPQLIEIKAADNQEGHAGYYFKMTAHILFAVEF